MRQSQNSTPGKEMVKFLMHCVTVSLAANLSEPMSSSVN